PGILRGFCCWNCHSPLDRPGRRDRQKDEARPTKIMLMLTAGAYKGLGGALPEAACEAKGAAQGVLLPQSAPL
ncbi:MAG: hypothetical protein ACXWC3_13995, partial [Burkholderiales bacterium]